jgi:hypothetical protein
MQGSQQITGAYPTCVYALPLECSLMLFYDGALFLSSFQKPLFLNESKSPYHTGKDPVSISGIFFLSQDLVRL